jgi:predicted amidohydrolase
VRIFFNLFCPKDFNITHRIYYGFHAYSLFSAGALDRQTIVKVAAIQTFYEQTDRRQALSLQDTVLSKIENAAALGAKLIVLPELCDLPYFPASEDQLWKQNAQDLNHHALVFKVREFAREKQVFVVLPVFEKNNDRYFSTAVLISDQGEILGVVRKTSIPRSAGFFENGFLDSSDESGFEVFRTSLGRIGITLARGGKFFKHAEEMMLVHRASLIIHPRAQFSGVGQGFLDSELLRHARDLGYGIVIANRAGIEPWSKERFSGGSVLISSHGKVLAQALDSGEEIIFAEMESEQVRVKTITPSGLTTQYQHPVPLSSLDSPSSHLH